MMKNETEKNQFKKIWKNNQLTRLTRDLGYKIEITPHKKKTKNNS
jgi:hypothetical protein